MAKNRPKGQWVRSVKTDSTAPPPGTFKGSAQQIARTMARKDVSPKGLGSGIRMIQYFINRAGRSLSASRRRELERAKRILRQRAKARSKRNETHTLEPLERWSRDEVDLPETYPSAL